VAAGTLDAVGTFVAGAEPGYGQARPVRHRQRLVAGAGGTALDEQGLPVVHLQRGEQRPVDGAGRQQVRPRLGDGHPVGHRMHLRALGEHELLVAALGLLVPLDGEAGVHRIEAHPWRQEIALAGVHRHEVADRDATL
jgi:hypothetical protein